MRRAKGAEIRGPGHISRPDGTPVPCVRDRGRRMVRNPERSHPQAEVSHVPHPPTPARRPGPGHRPPLGQAAYDGCEASEKLDVTGVDYAFEDLPSELDAGRVALRFTNATEADEAHELVLMRKADGTTETLDELLELPEEEAMTKLTPVGVVFSDQAGGTATTLVDLETGEYVAVCFIPTGGEDGPPHAFGGMAAEMTISRRLSVSPKTVRNHLSNVFTKLQVADRAQAIVRAREAGLGLGG